LNIDQAGDIARQYDIQGVPTVILFRTALKRNEFAGVLPKKDVEDFIKKNLKQWFDGGV